MDYQVYADGEALLGWLNCTVQISTSSGFDSADFLELLGKDLQHRLREQNAEVAHLKMTLSPAPDVPGQIALLNLVRNDFVPELSMRLDGLIRRGQLIINLRAEAAPEVLERAVREAVSATAAAVPGVDATLDNLEQFRPGKPTPTHRFTTATQ